MNLKENGQFFKPKTNETLFSEKKQAVVFGEDINEQLSLPENLGMDSIWEWNKEASCGNARPEEQISTK